MIGWLLNLFSIAPRQSGSYPPSSVGAASLFGSESTASGVPVDEWRALNYAAWWFGVRLISEAVASLPLHLYRRLPEGGKERATDEDLYWLLHDDWNEETSSFQGRETLQSHLLSWGNGYGEIERDGAGNAVAIWQLPPPCVTPDRNKQGRLVYYVEGDGSSVPTPAEDMLHVPGLGYDGVCGYSVIKMAKQSIGLGLATEKFGSTFFGNNARPAGLLVNPGSPQEPARKELKRSWTEDHGPHNQNRVGVLWGGWSWEDVGVPPEAAQFLESRAFQREEIGLWLNIPPFKLGVSKAATYASVEQFAIDFVVHTIRPWLVRWEAQYRRKLIPKARQRELFFEHLVDGLLRGDAASRTTALTQQFMNGALSQDEWREIENRNPVPDGKGKKFYVPRNLVAVDDPAIEATTLPMDQPPADDQADGQQGQLYQRNGFHE